MKCLGRLCAVQIDLETVHVAPAISTPKCRYRVQLFYRSANTVYTLEGEALLLVFVWIAVRVYLL